MDKIQLIKLYRQQTGCSLVEGKNAVESMIRLASCEVMSSPSVKDLRDYFAGQAIQSLISRSDWTIGVNNAEHTYSKDAYQIADAMLMARSNA